MKRNFALRTIRNGRVRINGSHYAPPSSRVPYDGRLDGQRFAFGLYYRGETQEPFVFLWGTERAYRNKSETPVDWPGPHCVGNSFPWDFWQREAGR